MRTVRIHPCSHRSLAEIGPHQGGSKLLECLLMTSGFGTGFLGNFRIEIIGCRCKLGLVAISIQQLADVFAGVLNQIIGQGKIVPDFKNHNSII